MVYTVFVTSTRVVEVESTTSEGRAEGRFVTSESLVLARGGAGCPELSRTARDDLLETVELVEMLVACTLLDPEPG